MPRNITVTLADGSQHVYANAPDDITPEAVQARAQTDFGQGVTALDGGKGAPAAPAPVAGPPNAPAVPPAADISTSQPPAAAPNNDPNAAVLALRQYYPEQQNLSDPDFIKYYWASRTNPQAPPPPTQDQKIQQSAADRSDQNVANSGNFLTALKAGAINSTLGLGTHLAALGERFLPAAITGNDTDASYSDILKMIHANQDADASKSLPGNIIGNVLGGAGVLKGAGGALTSVAGDVAPAVGSALEELGTLRQGEAAANTAKAVIGGAAGGATQAVGEGQDPVAGAAYGTLGGVAGTGLGKIAQVVSRPLRDFLQMSSAPQILRRITSMTPQELGAAATQYRAATNGAEPTLFELLPLADRNKFLQSAVSGNDNTVEQASKAIGARAAQLGPEMADVASTAIAPQRQFIRQGIMNDMATARGGANVPEDADLVDKAMNSPTDMSTLRDTEVRAHMAPHEATPVADNFRDLLPAQQPQNINGTIVMQDSDPEVSGAIRTVAGSLKQRAEDAGINGGDVSRLITKLRPYLGGKGQIDPNIAQDAIDHLQGVLDANAPEVGAANRAASDAYAARSRMMEGMKAGAAEQLRDSVQPGTNRAAARLVGNAYDTHEGAAGRVLGHGNSLANDLAGSPDEALRSTIGIANNSTSRQLAQNLGEAPAAQIGTAARAQADSADALSSALAQAGRGGNNATGPDLASALIGLHPGSFIGTKIGSIKKIMNMTYIPENRARTMVDMLFSQDPAMTQRAIDALSAQNGGKDALQSIAATVGATTGGTATEPTPRATSVAPSNLAPLPAVSDDAAPPAFDPYAKAPIAPTPVATMGKREDGSEKGLGFLGLRQRPDGGVSSEISVGVNLGGKETEIPAMVPGLTGGELNYMLSRPAEQLFRAPYNKLNPTEKSIMDKATAYARGRVTQGLSPFRQPGEPSPIAAVNAAESAPASTTAVGDDPNTPYGRQVISSLFPTAHITEDVRDPNSPLGKETPTSYHEKTQNAVDVRPIPGMTFQQFLGTIHDKGYRVVEAIDEVNHPSAHATGPHWHVVVVPGAGK